MRILSGIGQFLLDLFKDHRYDAALDDDAFYLRHYANTTIPKDIPIRVRKVCVEQLGRRWLFVTPTDWLIEDDELDFAELLYDIGEEFGISISHEDMNRIDGTFDDVVQYLVRRTQSSCDTTPPRK